MKKVLDIGSGKIYYKPKEDEEVIHIDRVKLEHVETIANIEISLPFKDNTFDKLIINHVLEHVNNMINIMEECYRVLKNQGELVITGPYYTSIGAFQDPTHKHFLTENTMNYFLTNTGFDYYSKARFELIETRFNYAKSYGLRFLPFKNILRYFLLNMVREIQFRLKATK